MFLDAGAAGSIDYGDAVAQRVSTAVRRLLDTAYADANAILRGNEVLLREMAGRLIHDETLGESALLGLRKRLQCPASGRD